MPADDGEPDGRGPKGNGGQLDEAERGVRRRGRVGGELTPPAVDEDVRYLLRSEFVSP